MKSLKRGAVVAALLISASAAAESLFDEASYRPLAAAHRAHRVGDNLTILVVENATASASADTTANKDGALTGSILNTTGIDLRAGLEIVEDFKGGGRVQRAGKLVAQITVTVQDISPNGELHVRGEQTIDVNNETQSISVEGRVRPEDIAANNTVLSTRLSNAHISYIGDGVLGEKQRPGIIWRFLSWLGLI